MWRGGFLPSLTMPWLNEAAIAAEKQKIVYNSLACSVGTHSFSTVKKGVNNESIRIKPI